MPALLGKPQAALVVVKRGVVIGQVVVGGPQVVEGGRLALGIAQVSGQFESLRGVRNGVARGVDLDFPREAVQDPDALGTLRRLQVSFQILDAGLREQRGAAGHGEAEDQEQAVHLSILPAGGPACHRSTGGRRFHRFDVRPWPWVILSSATVRASSNA